MAKKMYRVTVEETTIKYVDVEAESEEQAEEEAMCNSSDSDFYGHEWGSPEAVSVVEI